MKFKKFIPKVAWDMQQTMDRIQKVKDEIAEASQFINKIDSQINELKERKKIISKNIGNKNIYLSQLQDQLLEQSLQQNGKCTNNERQQESSADDNNAVN